jgi:hypothetical protein
MLALDHLAHSLESIRQGELAPALNHLAKFNSAKTATTPADLVDAGQLIAVGVDLLWQERHDLAAGPLRTAAAIVNRWLFRRGYRFVNGSPRQFGGADGPAA